jgi:hypothetical protein
MFSGVIAAVPVPLPFDFRRRIDDAARSSAPAVAAGGRRVSPGANFGQPAPAALCQALRRRRVPSAWSKGRPPFHNFMEQADFASAHGGVFGRLNGATGPTNQTGSRGGVSRAIWLQ